MRLAFARCALVAGSLTATIACGSSRNAAVVEGEWSLTVSYDDGPPGGTINCTFEQDGGDVTGRCDDLATLIGQVRGTGITFAIEGRRGRDRTAPAWKTTFAGTVDTRASSMRGTVSLSGQRGRFTAVRQTVRRDTGPPTA
jgi:hypothetical protein